MYRQRANYGFAREALEYAVEHPLQVDRGSLTGRVVLEGRPIHIPDVLADPEYRATDYQQALGYRTCLGVPLLRKGTTIGVFALTRDEVNPFTDKQIELVTTFADQAVIAIENVRLFDEVQARTRELSQSVGELRALGGGVPGGELDAGSRNRALHHRCKSGAAIWHRGWRHLPL